MKVGEIMTRGVEIASPDDTVQQAASRMAELDVGVLPVGENDRLVGMLTDRDIAIRAVAQGRGPDTKVREAMTPEVRYCFEDEDLDDVVRQHGREQGAPAAGDEPGQAAGRDRLVRRRGALWRQRAGRHGRDCRL